MMGSFWIELSICFLSISQYKNMKKQIFIAHDVKSFEDFVNRDDVEIISLKYGVQPTQSESFQEYFWGVIYYVEI